VSAVDRPAASVVVATRDRRPLLRRCLAALAAQRTAEPFEDMAVAPMGRLLTAAGRGPGHARNLGLREARGEVVLFTDDDTVAAPGWVQAALDFLARHPAAVGVDGPIESLPYDPLYEISLESSRPGAHYTANVAYRRSVLERVGGFRPELFPVAHCEDLDLGFRAEALGEIGFCESMLITHVPHSMTIGQRIRRGRMAASEVVLKHEHRERYGYANHIPDSLWVAVNGIRHYWSIGRSQRERLLRRPWLAGRLIAMAVGHSTVAFVVTLRGNWSRSAR
jgi:glycosyltransferase involved in cell wall biosynthesis